MLLPYCNYLIVLKSNENHLFSLHYIQWTEEVLLKNGGFFLAFFWISGPAGSGKPGASILDESLAQDHSNNTSNIGIGQTDP